MKRYFPPKRVLPLIVLAILLTTLMPSTVLAGLSPAQVKVFQSKIFYFNVDGTCTTGSAQVSDMGGPVTATQSQADIAKIIMGIAKTDGLGQNAALIGLMTGLDESTLTNLANSTVPLSESNPQKQGDGNNGSSLGVFQQQILDDWSTISSDPNNAAAVNQLMTPAYAAEAFFGSPSSSNAPPALSKGLQNVLNWQSLAPQVAAQQVQNPGPANAGNVGYQNAVLKSQPAAQSLLTQYWNSAPAVPLPVPITGSASTVNSGQALGSCPNSVSCSSPSPAPVAVGLSQVRASIICLAQQELQSWQSGQLKPGTNAYFKYSNNRSEEWCADFASWIYSQAGYPLGPTGSNGADWDVSFVPNLVVPPQDSSKFTYHSVASGYTPQPGDLAIHGGAHVNIVVSVDGSNVTLVGGDQGGDSYPTNVVSQYSITNPASDDPAITGYVSPNQ